MSAYDDERVEGMTTLGDAYCHRGRDEAAFIAGAHWALDSITRESGDLLLTTDWIEHLAARLLVRAKWGDL